MSDDSSREGYVRIPRALIDEFVQTFGLQHDPNLNTVCHLAIGYACELRKERKREFRRERRKLVADAIRKARSDGYGRNRADIIYGALFAADGRGPDVWMPILEYAQGRCPAAIDLLAEVIPHGRIITYLLAHGWEPA